MAINKIIDPNIAARAYAQNQGIGNNAVPNTQQEGVKFSNFLEDKVQSAIDTVKTGEVMSAKAITGEAGVAEVVQAVTEADLTVVTAKALIDKMVSAYQEIMRLPI